MLALSVFPQGKGKIIPLILGKLWGKKSWLPNDIQIISCSIIRCEYLLFCFVFCWNLFSFFLFWLVPQSSIYLVSGSWPFQQCRAGFHLMEWTLVIIRSIYNQLRSHLCASVVSACPTGRCVERLPVPWALASGVKALVVTSSISPCLVRYVGVVFSSGALPSVCGKQPMASVIAWAPWRILRDPFGQQLDQL